MECSICAQRFAREYEELDEVLQVCPLCLPVYSAIFGWLGEHRDREISEIWSRLIRIVCAAPLELEYIRIPPGVERTPGLIRVFIDELAQMLRGWTTAGDVADAIRAVDQSHAAAMAAAALRGRFAP